MVAVGGDKLPALALLQGILITTATQTFIVEDGGWAEVGMLQRCTNLTAQTADTHRDCLLLNKHAHCSTLGNMDVCTEKFSQLRSYCQALVIFWAHYLPIFTLSWYNVMEQFPAGSKVIKEQSRPTPFTIILTCTTK